MEEPNRSARIRPSRTPPLRTVFRRPGAQALGTLRPSRTSPPCNRSGRRMSQGSCTFRTRHFRRIRDRETPAAEPKTRKAQDIVVSSSQTSSGADRAYGEDRQRGKRLTEQSVIMRRGPCQSGSRSCGPDHDPRDHAKQVDTPRAGPGRFVWSRARGSRIFPTAARTQLTLTMFVGLVASRLTNATSMT